MTKPAAVPKQARTAVTKASPTPGNYVPCNRRAERHVNVLRHLARADIPGGQYQRESAMTINSKLERFAGKPVIDFRKSGDIAQFAETAPRLRCEYDDKQTLSDLLAAMLAEPNSGATQALVFGLWAEDGETYEVGPGPVIETLLSAQGQLPDLAALFFGDITYEENEISWIEQGDYSAIWATFPRLGHFAARGGNSLSLGSIEHDELHTLVIEAGGLPKTVVRQALAAKAPIRHLELWLGSDEYGADTSVDDFADLFAGLLFPQLETLALRNSQYSDALAEAIAAAPVLDRIRKLDLSMGTLTDNGARALIASGRLGKLKTLDISHHYVSPAVVEELRAATPGVVADEPQAPEDLGGNPYYYIAVSE
jgi:hypothetical protein